MCFSLYYASRKQTKGHDFLIQRKIILCSGRYYSLCKKSFRLYVFRCLVLALLSEKQIWIFYILCKTDLVNSLSELKNLEYYTTQLHSLVCFKVLFRDSFSLFVNIIKHCKCPPNTITNHNDCNDYKIICILIHTNDMWFHSVNTTYFEYLVTFLYYICFKMCLIT